MLTEDRLIMSAEFLTWFEKYTKHLNCKFGDNNYLPDLITAFIRYKFLFESDEQKSKYKTLLNYYVLRRLSENDKKYSHKGYYKATCSEVVFLMGAIRLDNPYVLSNQMYIVEEIQEYEVNREIENNKKQYDLLTTIYEG